MDMTEMYLTEKLVFGQVEELKPVDEIENNANIQDDSMDNKSSMVNINTQKPKIGALEMLLEAYFVQMEGALSRLSNMREYVDDTEDYISIILDDKQNQLLHIGIMLGTTLIVMHLGMAVIDSLNMKIHISVYDGVNRQFNEATAGIVGGCLCLLFAALLLLKTKGLLG
ncbi:unnamed protein product [Ilex paraguariensis]|uniref:Magnesium transporter n=1 Tax=Ilex paraguariensis TaxID=185542 RepID=A0ABC8S2V6_9AQUA